MDDVTDIRALIQQYGNPPEGLYTAIVRRLRKCGTMFDDRIKLSLTPEDAEQWAALPRPYLIVVPALSRPKLEIKDYDIQFFDYPRVVNFVGHFDAGKTDLANGQAWGAADQIDRAERQLLLGLINWHPTEAYLPTAYNGMRLLGARLPDVKILLVFVFPERFYAPELCVDEVTCTELGSVSVNIRNPCEFDVECDPCQPRPQLSVE